MDPHKFSLKKVVLQTFLAKDVRFYGTQRQIELESVHRCGGQLKKYPKDEKYSTPTRF